MFGIIRPCQHRLPEALRTQWMGHLCGLCLSLRGIHGQAARLATNYDGVLLSALVDAQREAEATAGSWRRAGPCPLRALRTAPVAGGEGARLAAAVSLVLASAKLRDHAADGDGALRRPALASAARRLAGSWDAAGARGAAGVGFDTSVLVAAVDRQQAAEALVAAGSPLLTATEPTETATAAAFAHTAVLAGRPANAAPLAEAGRLFGRLAHLLDAVEDLAADRASGAWNPIAATGTPPAEARRLCDDAARGVRLALRDVEFTDGRLVHTLLAHELPRSVDRAFGASCAHGSRGGGPGAGSGGGYPGFDPPGRGGPGPDAGGPGGGSAGRCGGAAKPPRRRGPLAGCAVWLGMCCTCQLCCRKEYDDPWRWRRREGWCHQCDDCGCSSCGW